MKNNFTLSTNIPSLQEAEYIAELINLENIGKPHMIPVTAKSVISDSKSCWNVMAYWADSWEFSWFTKLSSLWDWIFEKWSMIVPAALRWNGIWLFITENIFRLHQEKSIVAITNVPHVVVINNKLGLYEVTRSMWRRFLQIIEWPQKLLSTDRVFVNTELKSRLDSWEFS